ncbi:S-layer homology domain-containing protein [Ellagibacter isourolithinifaciens]|uniref:S-layer homology domain-containing protein n=1 Tax=Ellagibacter isourolithinifaciens TaxID=2137581 RepID=UPI002E76C02F|nr:S-layer homology domain-containing protein [Ellagibacter isourolithinifaciens]MEE0247152.1 S-layer homology domain-containing protein [Ellagibacter isourolithinifaciens]
MKLNVWSKALSVGVAASLVCFTPAVALASPESDAEALGSQLESVGSLSGGMSLDDALCGSESLLDSISEADSPFDSDSEIELQSVLEFPDCNPNEWYASAVTYVSDKGLITGYNDGTFGPYDNITRGQLVTILWRMEGKPVSSSAGFSDVSSSDFYYSAALWAQKNGVIKGYGDGTFGGERLITREEAAVMLANYANFKGYDTASDKAALMRISGWREADSWALDSLGWCVDQGLMSGKDTPSGAYLDPMGSTWRSAMAKMIMVLDRDVFGNPEPTVSQEQKEQRVLASFQKSLDDSGLSAKGARVGIVTSKTGEHAYLVVQPLNMTFSQVRYGYRNISDFRSNLIDLTETLKETSGSMYGYSAQEGANLSVRIGLFSSDDEVIYAAENGSSIVPLSYTMR